MENHPQIASWTSVSLNEDHDMTMSPVRGVTPVITHVQSLLVPDRPGNDGSEMVIKETAIRRLDQKVNDVFEEILDLPPQLDLGPPTLELMHVDDRDSEELPGTGPGSSHLDLSIPVFEEGSPNEDQEFAGAEFMCVVDTTEVPVTDSNELFEDPHVENASDEDLSKEFTRVEDSPMEEEDSPMEEYIEVSPREGDICEYPHTGNTSEDLNKDIDEDSPREEYIGEAILGEGEINEDTFNGNASSPWESAMEEWIVEVTSPRESGENPENDNTGDEVIFLEGDIGADGKENRMEEDIGMSRDISECPRGKVAGVEDIDGGCPVQEGYAECPRQGDISHENARMSDVGEDPCKESTVDGTAPVGPVDDVEGDRRKDDPIATSVEVEGGGGIEQFVETVSAEKPSDINDPPSFVVTVVPEIAAEKKDPPSLPPRKLIRVDRDNLFDRLQAVLKVASAGSTGGKHVLGQPHPAFGIVDQSNDLNNATLRYVVNKPILKSPKSLVMLAKKILEKMPRHQVPIFDPSGDDSPNTKLDFLSKVGLGERYRRGQRIINVITPVPKLPERSITNIKPRIPAPRSRSASPCASPARASNPGSCPASPTRATASPVRAKNPGSHPASPARARNPGSCSASSKRARSPGSRPVSPTRAMNPGSRPASPTVILGSDLANLIDVPLKYFCPHRGEILPFSDKRIREENPPSTCVTHTVTQSAAAASKTISRPVISIASTISSSAGSATSGNVPTVMTAKISAAPDPKLRPVKENYSTILAPKKTTQALDKKAIIISRGSQLLDSPELPNPLLQRKPEILPAAAPTFVQHTCPVHGNITKIRTQTAVPGSLTPVEEKKTSLVNNLITAIETVDSEYANNGGLVQLGSAGDCSPPSCPLQLLDHNYLASPEPPGEHGHDNASSVELAPKPSSSNRRKKSKPIKVIKVKMQKLGPQPDLPENDLSSDNIIPVALVNSTSDARKVDKKFNKFGGNRSKSIKNVTLDECDVENESAKDSDATNDSFPDVEESSFCVKGNLVVNIMSDQEYEKKLKEAAEKCLAPDEVPHTDSEEFLDVTRFTSAPMKDLATLQPRSGSSKMAAAESPFADSLPMPWATPETRGEKRRRIAAVMASINDQEESENSMDTEATSIEDKVSTSDVPLSAVEELLNEMSSPDYGVSSRQGFFCSFRWPGDGQGKLVSH
jgi:hypothetical protein